jgi:hypothetical protein
MLRWAYTIIGEGVVMLVLIALAMLFISREVAAIALFLLAWQGMRSIIGGVDDIRALARSRWRTPAPVPDPAAGRGVYDGVSGVVPGGYWVARVGLGSEYVDWLNGDSVRRGIGAESVQHSRVAMGQGALDVLPSDGVSRDAREWKDIHDVDGCPGVGEEASERADCH